MKFAFIAARDVAFPVSAMCRVLGVTRSSFYVWQSGRDQSEQRATGNRHRTKRALQGTPRH